MGRHRSLNDPADVGFLDGAWHVATSWPGMFPQDEQHCPCAKAPCGLAIPVASVECERHHGAYPIRQAHRVDDCDNWRKRRHRQ